MASADPPSSPAAAKRTAADLNLSLGPLAKKRPPTPDDLAPDDQISSAAAAAATSKFSPSSPLSSVKALLSTGLLEGVEITYQKSGIVLLHGTVKDLLYRCSCANCSNNPTGVSALEFERHAGGSSNNQNNHVFVKSGISIYRLFKDLVDYPLGSLDEVIEEKIGCSANMKRFQDWKESFQTPSNGFREASADGGGSGHAQRQVQLQNPFVTGDRNIRSRAEHHIEPCYDRRDSFQTASNGLRETGTNSFGSFLALRQAQLQSFRANGNGNIHHQPEFNVESSSDRRDSFQMAINGLRETSTNGVEGSRILRDRHLQSASTIGNGHIQNRPDLPSEPSSDKKVSFQTENNGLRETSTNGIGSLLGLRETPFQTTHVNGDGNVQNLIELHPEPCSDRSFLGPAPTESNPASSTNNELNSSGLASEGSFHQISITNSNFSSQKSVPTEDSTNPTSSILTPPIKEKRLMLESKSKREKRPSSSPYPACLPVSDTALVQSKNDSQGGAKKRDNDLHRLIFMENGLPDGSELVYRLKGEVKLRGRKFENGIMCSCCNEKVSPSKFEDHAGHRERRQPYRHIFTSDGLSLHELCITLMNGQNLSTVCDDLCTICGGGGDLVSCHRCPKAFHAACLKAKGDFDDELYCTNCKYNIGSTTAARSTSTRAGRPLKLRLTRIFKDSADELGGCTLCKTKTFSLEVFDEKTVMVCRQCEKEYHVGCLKLHGLCDLKAYPGKWFCCLDCDIIHAALRNLVFHGPKAVPDSLLGMLKTNEEKQSTNDFGVAVQWQLLGGQHQSSELLSQATSLFQDTFDPIIERGHDLIPAMIYGRDVAGQFFEGMYCAVLTIESVIVSAGILRIFGKGIAELPLVATRRDRQRKGYFRMLLLLIERLLSRLKVEAFMLPVAEEEESMWINKFGFVKMSEERLTKYVTEHPLLMFQKMTMLEKAVTHSSNNGNEDNMFTFSSKVLEA